MFKKPQNLKGLTVNLVQGLLKQRVFFLLFVADKSFWIALTFYGINFKISNLDLF